MSDLPAYGIWGWMPPSVERIRAQGVGTEKTLRWWSVDLLERRRKGTPEEVLMRWTREWAKEGVAVDLGKSYGPPKALWCWREGRWWSAR
jgi:hypothetical protein